MNNLKSLALAFVLIAGIGVTMVSCSDEYYYNEPEKVNPLPPGTDYPTKPGSDPYCM